MVENQIIENRIKRILYSGKIVEVDKSNMKVMADEIIFPENIEGQGIPVWGIENIIEF